MGITSDWERITFENLDKETLMINTNDSNVIVTFGDYKIIYDLYTCCCEKSGVLFHDTYIGINLETHHYAEYDKDKLKQIEKSFPCINTCSISHINDEIYDDGGAFILLLNDNLKITFFNIQNGYYSHNFSIYKGGEKIFFSSL